MNVRSAKISDAESISELIREYAERDRMLFRALPDIYEDLQGFIVAESEGAVVGCCEFAIIWSDLAEIKSLAVDEGKKGSGIGSAMVAAAVERARELGIKKIFALTLEPQFFIKQGFTVVDKESLPMKVWSDCAKCPKQDHCDEVAVFMTI